MVQVKKPPLGSGARQDWDECLALLQQTILLCRRISIELFQHVLNLDLKFHLMRKTGEVMRVMDRGTYSIQSILSTVIFSIAPQMLDILLACVYIASVLEPWIAIIMFVTLASYLPLTIYLTEWRTRFRR